jgi:7-cyano-7-deazaguanine synthase
MCSIFGYVGNPNVDVRILRTLHQNASDRGRDGGNAEFYNLLGGKVAWLGNWRATPTPEVEQGRRQPYDEIVHNGTIANAEELGLQPGEIDSEVLPRVLNRNDATSLAKSLKKIKGSYALAVRNLFTVMLACNYKPIHYWSPNGQDFFFASMERHFEDILPRGQAPVQVPPYSVLDLLTEEVVKIPRKFSKRAVVVCSAGLDSTTAAYKLKKEGWKVCLLHFLYGCKAENKEKERIKEIADDLQCPREFLTIPYKKIAGRSTLLKKEDKIGGAIEGAEYAIDWVPARNLVLVSLAVAYAEANGYHAVALGNNLEESGAYPDNEEQMFIRLNQAAPYFTQNGYAVEILNPLGNLMKHEVVKLGLGLGVPYGKTWSCYRGGDKPCNNCGPCFMRRVAFERNKTIDPLLKD